MLLAPAQLQRQLPQRGTAVRPRQSLYQPTGWRKPRRATTIVFAPTATGGRGAAGRAGAEVLGDGLAGGAAAACAAVAAAWSLAASIATAWALTACRTRRCSAAASAAIGTAAVAELTCGAFWAEAGCDVRSGRLSSQTAMPPSRGARQRRISGPMGRATPLRRQRLRGLHDRHAAATLARDANLRILDRLGL